MEKTSGSGLIYQPSSVLDFKSPELRPYLDRYVRGSNGMDAEARIKLTKLLLFYARQYEQLTVAHNLPD